MTESSCDLREACVGSRRRHLLPGALPHVFLQFQNGLKGFSNNDNSHFYSARPLDHFQSTATSPLILLGSSTRLFNPSFEAELPAALISIPPKTLNSTSLSFPQRYQHRSEMGWVLQQRSWLSNFTVSLDHWATPWIRGLGTIHRLSWFLHPSPSVAPKLPKEYGRPGSVSFGTISQKTASPIFPSLQCPLRFSSGLTCCDLYSLGSEVPGGPGLPWGCGVQRLCILPVLRHLGESRRWMCGSSVNPISKFFHFLSRCPSHLLPGLRILLGDLLPSKARSPGISGIWALPECRISGHCFIGSPLWWFHLQFMSYKKCPAPLFPPCKSLCFPRARPSGFSPTITPFHFIWLMSGDSTKANGFPEIMSDWVTQLLCHQDKEANFPVSQNSF